MTESERPGSGIPKETGREDQRGFKEIQEELKAFVDKPNENRERELKMERARLVGEAKEIGIFEPLKGVVFDIQANYDFDEAKKKISQINIKNAEIEASALSGWDERFSGILNEYRDVAVLNMELAMFKVSGQGETEKAQKLEREIEIRGWGYSPQGLERMALVHLEDQIKRISKKDVERTPSVEDLVKLLQENLGVLPQALAEQMGAIAPERVLEAYRRAEEGQVPFSVGPGSEPSFFVLYQKDENELERQRDFWEARSVLVQAAAHKLSAASIEGRGSDPGLINNDKMAIELNKLSLEKLFELPGVLSAVSIYTAIIGGEDYKKYRDPKAKKLSKEEKKERRSNNKGLPKLRTLLLGRKSKIAKFGFSEEETNTLLKERKKLLDRKEGCPSSIWVAKQDTFLSLRKGVRFWLKTKGRHLLFENKKEMERIAGEEKVSEVIENRARDAEQIAWNLVFTAGLIESFNSRAERPGIKGSDYLGASFFMTLYLWMLMHPQERFEGKIIKGEEWSAFGTWATNNIKKRTWKMENDQLVVPKIFTKDYLIKDAFREQSFSQKAFFDFFVEKGEVLLKNPSKISDAAKIKDDFLKRKEWKELGDAPFISYRFDSFKWASSIFSVFKKGEVRDMDLSNLAEAVRLLNLSPRTRENLLIAWFGVDPSPSQNPKPTMGKIDWNFQIRQIKRSYPTYFIE